MLKNAYLLAKIGADTAENERIFADFYQHLYKVGHVGTLVSDNSSRRL